MNWEGLAKEARELCGSLGLPDVAKQDIHREDIKSAVMYHNLKTVKAEMAPLKKLSLIKNSDCREMAAYMTEKSLEDSRLEFLWLTDMLYSRTTMSKKYNSPYCPHCVAGQVLGVVESPQHWLVCEAYRGFRDGVDPELVRRDRLPYLRKVIKKRRELEKKLTCQAQAGEDDLQEE